VLSDPDAQVVRVTAIEVNPDYDERTQDGDIATILAFLDARGGHEAFVANGRVAP